MHFANVRHLIKPSALIFLEGRTLPKLLRTCPKYHHLQWRRSPSTPHPSVLRGASRYWSTRWRSPALLRSFRLTLQRPEQYLISTQTQASTERKHTHPRSKGRFRADQISSHPIPTVTLCEIRCMIALSLVSGGPGRLRGSIRNTITT